MPIRINLLAEAHAAEEERRKDPVKRGSYVAAALVGLTLIWGAALQVKLVAARGRLSALDVKWKAIEKDYQVAVDAQRKNIEIEQKLMALHQMNTNRFLWGNVLNGLQQTMAGMDDVQVVKFKGDQSYVVTEGTPNRTNGTVIIPGKAPTATEKVSLIIEARDTSPQARRIRAFKDAIAGVQYFKDSLEKTNGVRLLNQSAPQPDPNNREPFVMFSLQCSFPEKTR